MRASLQAFVVLLSITGCAPGFSKEKLGGAAGVWAVTSHAPILNTSPAPDTSFTALGWHLLVEATSDTEGRVRLCTDSFGLKCLAFLEGPVVMEDDVPVWRTEFEVDDFPEHDCLLHEHFDAVFLVDGDDMTMISSAEQWATDRECEGARQAIAAEPGGRDVPYVAVDVIQFNELVRR